MWGSGAVIAHRAAAALLSFLGFLPGVVELIVPRGRQRAHDDGVIIHRPMSLPRADITTVDAIPVTTPARTLIDIAAYVPSETLEEVLDDALRRNLVTVAWLRWRLNEIGTARRRGSDVIARLIEARTNADTVPQSVFETRLLRVLRDARLPLPSVQHRIRTHLGTAVLDFAYVEQRVAIEADGFQWHSGRQQWDHDRERTNALTMLGWIVIRVTWTQLRDRPNEVIEMIGTMLASHRRLGDSS